MKSNNNNNTAMMKLFIIILSISFNATTKEYEWNRGTINLNGNVKILEISSFDAEIYFDDIKKGKSRKKVLCKYNEKGNLIENNDYNSDGSLYEKYIYKYDSKGNLIEINSYKSDGSLREKNTYKYDSKGNKI